MSKHYEMLWDCSNCNTKGLLGVSHRHCPHCGAVQDETKRYFPSEGSEVALENHRYHGRDWDCSYCSTPNSNAADFCVNCGAGKDGSAPVKLVGEIVEEVKEFKNPPTRVDGLRTLPADMVFSSYNTKEFKGDTKWYHPSLFKIAIIFVLIALIALVSAFFIKSDASAIVSAQQWSRAVNIEQYSSVSDSAWCSSMPFDAYSISRSREISGYKKIADGQTCTSFNVDRGDGSFTKEQSCTTNYREEPEYDYRCRYKVDRWKYSHQLQTKGSFPENPYWAGWSARKTQGLGAERIGSKEESYTVSLKGNEETWGCSLKPEYWKGFEVGTKVSLKVRLLGGADCSSLKKVSSK